MFKKSKHVKAICLAMLFSILALAVTLGVVAINVLNSQSLDDPLEGYDGEYEVELKKPVPPPILPDLDTESETEAPNTGEVPGPGGEHEGDEGDFEDAKSYRVFSNPGVQRIYLRSMSYGDYDGQSWLQAVPYEELIDGKYPATFLSSKYIEANYKKLDPTIIAIIAKKSTEILPHYMATVYEHDNIEEIPNIPLDDVNSNGPRDGLYVSCLYDYTNVNLRPVTPIPEYEYYEKNYREFVYANYLNVNDDIKEYMLGKIKEQGFDPYDEDLAENVADYISGSAKYSLSYDRTLDLEENVIIAFMENYKEGICQHFAASATMMLRTLGIPARYTVGYLTSTDGANYVTVDKNNAHAWVEVYVDGFGWKVLEATPEQVPEEPKPQIEIRPVHVERLYDGEELLPRDEITIEGFEAFAELGYTYSFVISGSRVEPGVGYSKIEEFIIYDAENNDVTERFDISKKDGTMLVYLGVISLDSESIDTPYEYDGGVIVSDVAKCSYSVKEGTIADNHTVSVESVEFLPLSIGVYPHKFVLNIVNDEGESVANCYKYVYNFGSVVVEPRALTIITDSAEKDYDGTPLVCDTYKVEGLLEGHTLTLTVNGTQTDWGKSQNVFDWDSITIIDDDTGDIVTSNYSISGVYGWLVVNW